MTNVELKTEASTCVSCDRMEIILSLSNDGLSMQASLNRLAECSSQLVSAMMTSGLDPAAFTIDAIKARSNEARDKQSAAVILKASGQADLKILATVWETLSSLSFPVEIEVHFHVEEDDRIVEDLQKEALRKASVQADEMAAFFKTAAVECQTVVFEPEMSVIPSMDSTLNWHGQPDSGEPYSLSFFKTVQIPSCRFCVRAKTNWSFS